MENPTLSQRIFEKLKPVMASYSNEEAVTGPEANPGTSPEPGI